MAVSNQLRIVGEEDGPGFDGELKGARARTARLMLETASAMMQEGKIPSVTDVAAGAGVSRATAYRYFPTQAALVAAVVDEALGPILEWHSTQADAADRVTDLLATSLPRLEDHEATFRAALKLALEQSAASATGDDEEPARFRRGHRVDLLREATASLAGRIGKARHDRLVKALSLVFGVEALVILKDICGAEAGEVREIVSWAALALVNAAIHEANV